jgi:hypothetical protein
LTQCGKQQTELLAFPWEEGHAYRLKREAHAAKPERGATSPLIPETYRILSRTTPNITDMVEICDG